MRPRKPRRLLLRPFSRELLDEVGERLHLARIDQIELLRKEEEVLEYGVEVRLLAELLDAIEVVDVDEGEDAEESLEDRRYGEIKSEIKFRKHLK